MNTWDQVCMLMIDEISFSSEDQMDKLNVHLNRGQRKRSNSNEVLSPNMIFGRCMIIFLRFLSTAATCEVK